MGCTYTCDHYGAVNRWCGECTVLSFIVSCLDRQASVWSSGEGLTDPLVCSVFVWSSGDGPNDPLVCSVFVSTDSEDAQVVHKERRRMFPFVDSSFPLFVHGLQRVLMYPSRSQRAGVLMSLAACRLQSQRVGVVMTLAALLPAVSTEVHSRSSILKYRCSWS